MQADQTGISLRPGGGGGLRGSRFVTPRFDSSSADSSSLRPHGGVSQILKVEFHICFLFVNSVRDVVCAIFVFAYE